MKIKLKKLSEQVIVITGASSGIGLATAEMAAAEGARLVLTARDEMDLRQVCDRINADGGRAVYVAGDVANPDAMEMVANKAVSEFGALDTWVNSAGIGMFGRLTEMSMADKRRLFDVNFWGVVHGCRPAVRTMRENGGAIINIGSVTSDRAMPLLGIYTASKQAVKGYTDALRTELEEEGVPIAVTLVKPPSINTPLTEHARNYMTEEPEYAGSVYPPEEVARAILRCAERPVRDVNVGGGGKVVSLMEIVAPRTTDLVKEHGHRERHQMRSSAYTRAALSDVGRVWPVLALGAVVAVAIGAIRRAG